MACPQVGVGVFVAARRTGRGVMIRMVRMAAKVIQIG
jgi:hypothetical protein